MTTSDPLSQALRTYEREIVTAQMRGEAVNPHEVAAGRQRLSGGR